MDSLSFTHVPADGFTSFEKELGKDAWGAIDVAPWEGPNRTAVKPLGDAPSLVVHKLRLKWSIATFVLVLEGAGSAKERDKAWDSAQKQLRSLLGAAAASSDAQKREAAGRLQKSLLLGAGEGQTRLKYQQEVDFGRKQALLTSSGQAAADITLLALGGMMAEIEQATDALAVAIGHGESAVRPFERVDAASAGCVAAFAVVADELGWASESGQAGSDRERAKSLRAPLEQLAARYKAPKEQAATPAPAEAGSGGSGGG